jgi:hypothetical protein
LKPSSFEKSARKKKDLPPHIEGDEDRGTKEHGEEQGMGV